MTDTPSGRGGSPIVLRFVHLADVHLGRLHAGGLSGEKIEQRRTDTLLTFLQMLTDVAAQSVPLVLIAGDLFEHQLVDHTTVVEVIQRLAGLPDITFCVCAGNHDYAAANSPYRTLAWPANVHLFLADWEQVRLDHLGVTVHGRGFSAPECTEAHLREYQVPEHGEELQIVLLHADYPATASRYLPITKTDLHNCTADYVALGHVHNPQILMGDHLVKAAYSGALEPLDFGELGEHGYFLGELTKGGAKLQFVPVAARRYHQVLVSIDGVESMDAVLKAADAAVDAIPDGDMVRLILQGHVSTQFVLDPARLASVGERFFAFDIVNEAHYDADLAQLAAGHSVRAHFIRRLQQQMETDDESARQLAHQALLMGLDALAGKEVRWR
jgi:exonuclease SbcD